MFPKVGEHIHVTIDARLATTSGIGTYLNPRGLRVLAALDQVAEGAGARPAEVALAWQMAKPGVTAPIASATTPAQVQSLIRAATLKLSASDMALLDGTGN